ncbi:thiamine pyrophosphate-binding protein [Roseitranquillus sediminis]|uniref:thiamine pyrophosphate-binding protein n=1 Tax=Roseitranquillus sediminis TaxID=2809051 RepID=UPI001D0C9AF0|nr:thiamine pyrophosphate-binding protein [Roseitranquillus sediminis]MBM9593642.1 thiamine pyrophosphate-binding protein [Roseitranquillus sediminis]
MRHGGRILADALALHGVRRVFSIPGESFLAALDGFHDTGVQNVVCRHEGAAAMAADATGKLTGRPGVAFVTRGPGATNAAAGVHVARQDSTPMILFVGQIARGHRDREAFQELDYRAVFGGLSKWVAEVDETERLPEYVMRAFHVAQSGRPGPVVLALPEDVLSAEADVPDLPPTGTARQAVDPAAVDEALEMLARAERPLIVAGGPEWSQRAADDLARFAEGWRVPVAVAFRRQDRIDNTSPAYAGDLGVGANPALVRRLAEADLVLALGTRLGDIVTAGYETIRPAEPPAIVHVHPAPDLPGTVYRTALTITARAPDAVAALAAPEPRPRSDGSMEQARADYDAWQSQRRTPGALRMEEVVARLAERLPTEAIVTNGAGNYAAWLHRYFRWRRYGTQVSPTSGSMGYGLPAAIAAKLERPEVPVVCLAGDGCFQMTGNEFATAVQHGANVVVLVCDNGRYGTIRMHQERAYPGRVSGTDLINPDFAALARAHGGHGETVQRDADFPAALDRALAAERPAILHLRLDPRTLSTGADLPA